MTALSLLAVAALLGGVNFHLNDKYSNDAINRDSAAKLGVASGAFLFAAIVVGAFHNFNGGLP